MKTDIRFIVIDDDPINNFLCNIILKKLLGTPDFQSFTIPEKGLMFIEKELAGDKPVILFLDINMPGMTGWDVLERFALLSDNIKSLVKIYILSSSVDERDKEKASKNPYVSGYIV